MPLTHTRTTDAAAEPVTVDEVKAHCRIEHSFDDDVYLPALIKAARMFAEDYTDRAFITQTWAYKLDEFPCSSFENPYAAIVLPRARAIAISSIAYVDEDGTTQTLSSSLYQVDTSSEPARVIPAWGETWPDTRSQLNAVTITYTAGYGAAAAVPENIKLAIKFLVGQWYENREPTVTGTIVTEVPFTVKALLNPFRVAGFY